MRNSTSPAKITAPHLGDVVNRERLYKVIDDSDKTPVICISAPAGYGKTTLINAYIEKRNLPCLWYKVDAGDGDISSFFYYLGLAIKKATGIKKNMPLLKPEYQLGIPAFTRHYFREMFTRLSTGTVVVFDNYQDAGKDSALHDLMPEAIQEVAQGCRMVFISREKPPCEFAKSNANGGVLKINTELLAFTCEESIDAAKLFGVNKKSDVDLLKKIHACSKGWVTGFKLLLNKKDELKDIEVDLEAAGQDIVFDYFMGEILNRTDPETKMFLFKISVLPVVTVSLAKKLTGLANTKKILNGLVRKQFFTSRHGRYRPTYEFHPLFQKFLVEQCENQLSQSEFDGLYKTSGYLLADIGDYENAIELLTRSESWGAIIKLLEEHSKNLIDQGRNLQLVQWIDNLPTEKISQNVWINYWHGMALINYDNKLARDKFKQAYQLSKENNNVQGLYLSWCGIADSFSFSHNNFTESIIWIEELQWLKLNFPQAPSIEARCRFVFSAAMLIMWADPGNPGLINWVNKIELLYKVIPNRAIKILSASQLILYYGERGEVKKVRQLSVVINRITKGDESPDFLTDFLKVFLITCDYITADFQLTNADLDLIFDSFQDTGLSFCNGFVLPQSIYHAEIKGDVKRVKYLLEKFKDTVSEDSDLDFGHYHFHEGIYLTMHGDISRAIHHIEIAVELTVKAHSPYPESLCRSYLAYLYSESDCLEDAIKEVDKSEQICRAFNSYSGLAVILFIRSWVALKSSERDLAVRLLKEAFDVMYEKDIKSYTIWPYKMISGLCAIALENNIRPEFVKQIIATHQYTPQDNICVTEYWPYPVKIYTLNRFGIVKDGQALRLSDKNQQFIKALIAFGGRDVHEATLSDALWPDAEGDAAHQNFATTLHRVRKAVGSNVIQLRQNRVSLDPDFCWIDIWALKRNLNEINKSLLNSKHLLQELTEDAISLYQGPFLGADENEYWILSAREKLSNQLLKMLDVTAESFSQSGQYRQALACYQQALEIDDLLESTYQGIMHCYMQSGHRAEGLAVYRLCCERLNKSLGIDPSSKTEKLYQALTDS